MTQKEILRRLRMKRLRAKIKEQMLRELGELAKVSHPENKEKGPTAASLR
jgi:hypothetical protein